MVDERYYTLEELAWLSRCLLPGSFYNKLIELGVNEEIASDLQHFLMVREDVRPKNVLDVYQACLCGRTDEIKNENIDALHVYIDNFLKRD